jgi:iron complex outermembrane receptor protein
MRLQIIDNRLEENMAFEQKSGGKVSPGACGALSISILSAAVTLALAPGWARAGDDALEEIVVTAERRVERVQDTPIAITAISEADLEKRGVRIASDITAAVPNMVFYSPYGEEAQPFFSLRGVTTNDWSQNQSSPIAMYVDDIYKSVGAVQALQAFDLDRVEVLRGPQGTLYGKNATGGAVNYYSKNPDLSQSEGYATVGFGNYSDRSLRAAFGAPIVEGKFGVRGAVYYEKRDGWMKSVAPGVEPFNSIDALAGRLTFLWKPITDLSAQLKLSSSRSGGTPYGVKAINVDPNPYSVDGFGTGFSGDYGWFNNGSKLSTHKDIRNDTASLKVDWQVSDHATLTSVTGVDYGRWWEKSDDSGLAMTDLNTAIHIDDPNTYFSSVHAFSQEFRIASRDSGAFNWLAGAFYGRDTTHATVLFHYWDSVVSGYFLIPQDPSNPAAVWNTSLWGFDQYNSFDQERDSKALFANLTWELAPTLTLRAGARYTKDTISIHNFYALEGGVQAQPTSLAPDMVPTWWTQTIGAAPAAYVTYSTDLASQGPTYPTLSRNTSNFSTRLGLDWKISKEMLAYASFSQGYRGEAFNGQAYNGPQELNFVEPEKLNAYELGVKSEMLERRLQVNAAAFFYQYRNQQFLDTYCTIPLVNNSCTSVGYQVRNAPRSRIAGLELEVRAKPDPALELRFDAGMLDTKYQELTLHFADRSGNKLIMAPDLSLGAQFDWRMARFATSDLHFVMNGNYYSKQYFDALDTERVAQPAYSLLNARVSLDGTGGRQYTVGLWVKNIANKKYLAEGLPLRNPSDGGLGFDYALVGEPRTFGLDLTWRF